MNVLTLSVVIPTRNRPDRLKKCLEALLIARQFISFECCVCDSTQDPSLRQEVETVVEQFQFARYFYHTGKNAAAARNYCAKSASGDLLITVDDDVYVEPESIKRLHDHYVGLEDKNGIVSGSVKFGDAFSRPVVMRPNGYGRNAQKEELFDFVVSAFLLYPRAVIERYPWNERIKSSEDRLMGSLWRRAGVEMHFLESAKAIHDVNLNSYDVAHQRSHIYANLFDAIFVRKSIYWLFCFEFLGFAAGAKKYFQRRSEAFAYIDAWYLGHKDFIHDWDYLQKLGRVNAL
jgi:glycosyltransferase involved in cell wall biosynthesis